MEFWKTGCAMVVIVTMFGCGDGEGSPRTNTTRSALAASCAKTVHLHVADFNGTLTTPFNGPNTNPNDPKFGRTNQMNGCWDYDARAFSDSTYPSGTANGVGWAHWTHISSPNPFPPATIDHGGTYNGTHDTTCLPGQGVGTECWASASSTSPYFRFMIGGAMADYNETANTHTTSGYTDTHEANVYGADFASTWGVTPNVVAYESASGWQSLSMNASDGTVKRNFSELYASCEWMPNWSPNTSGGHAAWVSVTPKPGRPLLRIADLNDYQDTYNAVHKVCRCICDSNASDGNCNGWMGIYLSGCSTTDNQVGHIFGSNWPAWQAVIDAMNGCTTDTATVAACSSWTEPPKACVAALGC